MSFLKKAAIIPALFAAGLLVAYLVPLAFPPNAQPTGTNEEKTESHIIADAGTSILASWADENQSNAVAQHAVVPPTRAASNALQAGDEHFEAGDVAAALKRYEAVASTFQGELPPVMRLRLALCSESLGDSNHALTTYGMLASGTDDARIRLAATIGLARVSIQIGRPVLAKQILWKCLREDSPAEEYAGQFTHLLARLLADQATTGGTPNLLPDSSLANPPRDTSVAHVLSWTKKPETESHVKPEKSDSPASHVTVVQRLSDTPGAIRMDAALERMPLFTAFERIAQKTGIQTRWSSEARGTIAGRTIQLRVTNWDVATILDSMLDPNDLAWAISDNTISVRTQSELSAEALQERRARLVERSLRRAITTYPEHRTTPHLYWLRGNLAFHQGRLDEAVADYRQLLELFPKTPGKAKVHFNVAKAKLLLGRGEDALDQLYRAVDEGTGDEIVAAAYLFIGRSYLEDDRPSLAIKPLARAATLANQPDHEAVATLTLAGAFLLLDNPRAANEILMGHRTALRRAPYSDQGAFLAALARFRTAKGESQLEHEGRTLIAALSHVYAREFFGQHAYAIFGTTLRDLELIESAKSVLREGLSRAGPGPIRDRFAYQLALCELDTENTEEAKRLLQSIAEQGRQGDWALDARLNLAGLAYDDGDDDECIELCSALIQSLGKGRRRTDAMRLMGQAYQRLGDRRLAALCFSGLPELTAVDEEETP